MNTETKIIPDDYKDYVYRVTYFFLGKIAHVVPRSVTPNQITVLAFLCAMIGNVLLVTVNSPMAYLYWVVFNFAWYLLDALDGIHARTTGQSSEYGAFLDHAFDNVYFLFMLTAFVYKFDLLHLFYVYILLLRVTVALMVFTVQCHTGRLYLSRFSGGVELVLFSVAMVLSYCYPHFNLLNHISSPLLLHYAHILNLQTGAFMKIALWTYAIGVPITIVQQFWFVKSFCQS